MGVREPMDRYLSPAEPKRFYDRFGSRQDWQGFFENPAINELVAHAAFDSAQSVFESGCAGHQRDDGLARAGASEAVVRTRTGRALSTEGGSERLADAVHFRCKLHGFLKKREMR